jgi:hypothetical protein
MASPGRPPKDYTGQKVGHVEFVKSTGKVTKRGYLWWCLCHLCGRRFKRVPNDVARNGKQVVNTACGCLRAESFKLLVARTKKRAAVRARKLMKLRNKGMTLVQIAQQEGVSKQAISQSLARFRKDGGQCRT